MGPPMNDDFTCPPARLQQSSYLEPPSDPDTSSHLLRHDERAFLGEDKPQQRERGVSGTNQGALDQPRRHSGGSAYPQVHEKSIGNVKYHPVGSQPEGGSSSYGACGQQPLVWTPMPLRTYYLAALIALCLAILITLEVIHQVDLKHSGLSTPGQKLQFLWTYGPTARESPFSFSAQGAYDDVGSHGTPHIRG